MGNEVAGVRPGPGAWVVHDRAGLDALAPGWATLQSHLDSPAQSLAWTRACADAFAGEDRLAVVGVGPRDAPRALAPLVYRPGTPGCIELLGVRQTYEPSDLLYASEEGLHELVAALVQSGTPLLLRRLVHDSPAATALQRAYRWRGVVHAQPAGSCPFIPLDSSWCEPEQHFNRHQRTNFRRAWNLAREAGELSFEVLSPTPETLARPWQEALDVEDACWKSRSGTSLKANAALGGFFERWAREAAAAGTLRLAFLRVNGAPVGVHVSEVQGGRYWTLKVGYDERFAAFSPGALLNLHVLAWAAAQGLRSFEFFGFAAEWTRRWTRLERPCVSLRIYPAGVRGLAAFGRDVAAKARRKLTSTA
jgi:CelD/BcsL family acetyltransferase involved in cellulose biosynthesis